MNKLAIGSIVTALFFLGGCASEPPTSLAAPEFSVSVNSIASPDSIRYKTYHLQPNPGIDDDWDDLQFQEYAMYVMASLGAMGYSVVEPEKADLTIFLTYGISDPQASNHSYSLPVSGQTGVASSVTTGVVNSGVYSGTTTNMPTYGVVGYQQVSKTLINHTRFVSLGAYDYQHFLKTKENKQVWRTDITSTGSSGDLRRVFPVLIASAGNYMGRDTGKAVMVSMLEDDKRVTLIKEFVALTRTVAQEEVGKDITK